MSLDLVRRHSSVDLADKTFAVYGISFPTRHGPWFWKSVPGRYKKSGHMIISQLLQVVKQVLIIYYRPILLRTHFSYSRPFLFSLSMCCKFRICVTIYSNGWIFPRLNDFIYSLFYPEPNFLRNFIEIVFAAKKLWVVLDLQLKYVFYNKSLQKDDLLQNPYFRWLKWFR